MGRELTNMRIIIYSLKRYSKMGVRINWACPVWRNAYMRG
jgi:hypothetical protein